MFTSVVWLYLCVAYIGRHKGSMDLSLCTFLFILFEDFRVGVLDVEECRRLPFLKADKQGGKKGETCLENDLISVCSDLEIV